MNTEEQNIDAAEVAKFDALASRWWDPAGEFRPLHEINPLQAGFSSASGAELIRIARALDVGCGGGILAESMAQQPARMVTGIDVARRTSDGRPPPPGRVRDGRRVT